jgi:hypothetical protein
MKRNNIDSAVLTLLNELQKHGPVSVDQFTNLRDIFKTALVAYNPPPGTVKSIAATFKNRMRQPGANRDNTEEALIEASIDCQRYGTDDLMYFFEDGSQVIKQVLTDSWL